MVHATAAQRVQKKSASNFTTTTATVSVLSLEPVMISFPSLGILLWGQVKTFVQVEIQQAVAANKTTPSLSKFKNGSSSMVNDDQNLNP